MNKEPSTLLKAVASWEPKRINFNIIEALVDSDLFNDSIKDDTDFAASNDHDYPMTLGGWMIYHIACLADGIDHQTVRIFKKLLDRGLNVKTKTYKKMNTLRTLVRILSYYKIDINSRDEFKDYLQTLLKEHGAVE